MSAIIDHVQGLAPFKDRSFSDLTLTLVDEKDSELAKFALHRAIICPQPTTLNDLCRGSDSLVNETLRLTMEYDAEIFEKAVQFWYTGNYQDEDHHPPLTGVPELAWHMSAGKLRRALRPSGYRVGTNDLILLGAKEEGEDDSEYHWQEESESEEEESESEDDESETSEDGKSETSEDGKSETSEDENNITSQKMETSEGEEANNHDSFPTALNHQDKNKESESEEEKSESEDGEGEGANNHDSIPTALNCQDKDEESGSEKEEDPESEDDESRTSKDTEMGEGEARKLTCAIPPSQPQFESLSWRSNLGPRHSSSWPRRDFIELSRESW
ncbi:hypothetical protein QBC37DRAFT_369892 [Rhypophila decipiens]|uniref:BTB domain-containing protein n=1 Tax=Rhypophila decipiens TaxID=261697 RepID=A0AAN6YFC6_9PEZI|nr:hypothetical protein QBC37DRAFT_369892 [Rhypophila decipiens]